jgi:hypothetical protein
MGISLIFSGLMAGLLFSGGAVARDCENRACFSLNQEEVVLHISKQLRKEYGNFQNLEISRVDHPILSTKQLLYSLSFQAGAYLRTVARLQLGGNNPGMMKSGIVEIHFDTESTQFNCYAKVWAESKDTNIGGAKVFDCNSWPTKKTAVNVFDDTRAGGKSPGNVPGRQRQFPGASRK